MYGLFYEAVEMFKKFKDPVFLTIINGKQGAIQHKKVKHPEY